MQELEPLDRVYLVFCNDPTARANFVQAIRRFGPDDSYKMIERLERLGQLSADQASQVKGFILGVACGHE
jgi:hypothetical protein